MATPASRTAETVLASAEPAGHVRHRSVVDVYVLLHRADGQILMLRRRGTGYADGLLCPPSGHLEADESVTTAAVREADEEVGVQIEPADLRFVHVVHHRNSQGQGRIGPVLHHLPVEWRALQP